MRRDVDRSSGEALVFTGLTGAFVAGGAASVSDAADGWQGVLNTISQLSRNQACHRPFTVPGWGTTAVLAFAVVALGLVGLTGWGLLSVRRWGMVTSALALVPIWILWLDAYAVGQAPSTNCDSLGLSGASSAAVTRAGWCFFAASILCAVAWASLAARFRRAG